MSKALSKTATESPGTYGIMAEFADSSALIHAASHIRDAGYTKVEAFTPIPVHGLDEAIGHKASRLPWLVLAGGLTGSIGLFGFMTWVNLVDYPMNIGGRPHFSWPAFVPITFEGMVLFFRIRCGIWAIPDLWIPKPLPPCLQCTRVRARFHRRVLPVY